MKIFNNIIMLIKYPLWKIRSIYKENKRKNNIMIFRPKYVNVAHPNQLKWDERVIYLSEIQNMPGHCIVISCTTNNIYHGLHIEDFKFLDIQKVRPNI